MQTPAERAVSLDFMRTAAAELRAAVTGLTPAQLTIPYVAGEWTVAQNVHHMPDSHAFALNNCLIALSEERPTWRDYDVDGIARLRDAVSADLEVSLVLFDALQARWVRLFESLSDADYARTGIASWGEFSIDDTLRIYSRHTRKHIEQITATLAAAR
jgi:hypothetical protein